MTKLLTIYNKLLSHFGPQHWWPGDTPFEIMIGAILTQNTNWANVEKAIANLKRAKRLNPHEICVMRNANLESLIRPSGYFRVKAKKLRIFCKWLIRRGGMRNVKRSELLAIWGIGPETADSMLCYALGKTTFVVDAYTRRIGKRVGLFEFDDYHQIKDYFEKNLPRNLKIYKEFHALLVALGKDYCRPKPICGECPINKLCSCVAKAKRA